MAFLTTALPISGPLPEKPADITLPEGLVLIDGACVLCSASFRFVAQRDKEKRFKFATIQGTLGQGIARAIGIDPDEPDSFAVILGGHALFKSEGAISILRTLPGWGWAAILLFLPRPLRDWAYDRVARNRYRLFGRLDSCILPSAEFEAHVYSETLRP